MESKFSEVVKAIRRLPMTQNLHFSTRHTTDLIGPPNPVSNLRPIKFAVRENELESEKLLRKRREELQQWNDEFWTNHNTRFMKEKEEFIKNELKKKNCAEDSLSADEMSVFYKHFLDKNWKNHFHYNASWHGKNFQITFLDILVRLQRLFNRGR